ncbi:electron transfer flavoprotein subunit alpha [Salinarchaeum sp. Harcht-Bsk1]|uniref:electron transfer flavoprotein subunit alpha/FixB family protein n=1 Tax=Salinarchaeum sp. Harcht-Bsk1 TaxID=1333523 RepID=UPI0003424358|nr:electron transfer flavoprotein subunit alpha/FixB family protein [Salinarchaeum sp. Harcht-Bsk1]AGN00322.1 electron transfer flavoprotein subunit alpha [Salinarchaeum sp. Harcht-Bsk1]
MSDVLAVAEHRRGELRPVSHELLTVGREVADASGGDLHVAVISGTVEEYAEDLNREGVDAIHTIANGEEFNHDLTVESLDALWADLDATYLLAPNSVNGLDYVPAIAQRLDLPLVTDTIDVSLDDGLEVTRERYGSKVETTIAVDVEAEGGAVVSVRDGEWPPAEGVGDAAIEAFDPQIDESRIRSTVTGFQEVGAGDVDISEADFIVSIGRGIEEEENIELIEALVEATGATLSASRPVVDNEWLPKNRQVGQSGKTVTPDVYIAIGISGAVQHVAGMKGSDTIVAINTDPDAPIFDIADYGIVGDLFDVVPALIEEFGGEAP